MADKVDAECNSFPGLHAWGHCSAGKVAVDHPLDLSNKISGCHLQVFVAWSAHQSVSAGVVIRFVVGIVGIVVDFDNLVVAVALLVNKVAVKATLQSERDIIRYLVFVMQRTGRRNWMAASMVPRAFASAVIVGERDFNRGHDFFVGFRTDVW